MASDAAAPPRTTDMLPRRRVVRTVWGDGVRDLVGRVGAELDGVRESPQLRERVRQGRAELDEDLRALLTACGHEARLAELVLIVVGGSIVSSGIEGYADEAFARAAQDVAGVLEQLGRG